VSVWKRLLTVRVNLGGTGNDNAAAGTRDLDTTGADVVQHTLERDCAFYCKGYQHVVPGKAGDGGAVVPALMYFSSGTTFGMEVLMPGTANRLANARLARDGIL